MSTVTILKPYTREEIRARMEIAESESAAGLGTDSDKMIRELETEFAQEDMKQYVFCKQIVFP